MKALTEIKNNLQGNNSRVDEAKNQINSLEYNEAKKTQRDQQKEKRIDLPNEGNVRSLWDKSSIPIFTYHGGARGRRERAQNWKSI